jgi:hypothetical protein
MAIAAPQSQPVWQLSSPTSRGSHSVSNALGLEIKKLIKKWEEDVKPVKILSAL